MMTDPEFSDAMHSVALACRLLLNLDGHLDGCLDHVGKGETLGPVLDPTGFAAGGGHLLADTKRLLEAAVALRDVASQVAPERLDLARLSRS